MLRPCSANESTWTTIVPEGPPSSLGCSSSLRPPRSSLAEALNSKVLSQPNFLADASAHTTVLATGALLLFGQFGVVGIAVLLFPLLKRHGESLALAHVGFRVTELAASLFYLAVPLLAIELGAGLSDGTIDGSASSSLGALLQAQHNVAILMIYIATGAAGICMATLLYRSRLIPRWLAILGLVTYPTFWRAPSWTCSTWST